MAADRFKVLDTKDPQWSEFLSELTKRIVAIDPHSRVFVFGSFVRQEFTAASDLDIAVVLNANLKKENFLKAWYQIPPLTQWPVDLVVLESERFEKRKEFGGVAFDIYHEGIELYPQWRLK
jgi:predicted nucleotidyltransferase